jgi:hypothetical protein
MWTPDLTSSSVFLELSGVLFTAYVVLARRNREAARSQLEGGDGLWAELESPRAAAAEFPVRERAPRAPSADHVAPRPPPSHTPASLRRLVDQLGQGAVPELAEALRCPDPKVGEAAANLLGELGGPAALRALLDADTPTQDLDAPGPPLAARRPTRTATPAPPAPSEPEGAPGSWAPQSLKEALETPFARPAGDKPAPEAEEEAVLPVLKLYEPLARNDFRALHRYCPHDPRDLDEEGLAEVLLRLVEDRSAKPALRYFSLKNLVRFRHRDIAETLEDMLADPLPLVRYAAADALAVHGDEGAVALLVEALEDPEGSVRASAAHTLAVLGGDMAIRPLLSLRDDPDEVVRYAARRALDAIGKRKKITRLLKQA